MNHLLASTRLRNRYLVMRHGHSLANRAGLIVSHPQHGCSGYGLSEEGRQQVSTSLEQATGLDHETVILSSDFERARESADIVARQLSSLHPVEYDERLRERHFGEYDLGPDDAYHEIWQRDQQDPDHCFRGVESANQVLARVSSLITWLEDQHDSRTLLLVSHGDALQILQCAFLREDASRHRALEHLHTGEIRRLELG